MNTSPPTIVQAIGSSLENLFASFESPHRTASAIAVFDLNLFALVREIARSEIHCESSSIKRGMFHAIISFGDLLTDTGNLLFALNNSHRVNRLPYGETFFYHPTGRFSDGRLIADIIANAVGLPFLAQYLLHYGDGRSFKKGLTSLWQELLH
ncbi:hypothetical protein J5N97_001164 [Dioscorea zingiberensis]|uniref:Uncharacterized protein n=1 Tax=Dioscorea zingiberensis TaxID=325984 RepID=A0A9D5BUB9_9LILI|nr:hypothetical protein J5N97_001164 [Dioscorea zingiberensis]